MNEELDFDDYPTLHLHLMIDDYDELCEQAQEQKNVESITSEGGRDWHGVRKKRLSFT